MNGYHTRKPVTRVVFLLVLLPLLVCRCADHFKILATGGTGFRAVSNLLFNRQAYLAFVDWMRFEMPHIHDLKPTTETDYPHQIFAYKGDALHNTKTLTFGHSTIIDKNILAQSAFTLDDYLQVTAGRPDPEKVISLV